MKEQELISRFKAGLQGEFIIIDHGTGEQFRIPNKLPTKGLQLLARALRLFDCSDIYGCVGTGTTPPSASDTKLENELVRVSLTVDSQEGGKIILDFFFPEGTGTGNWGELGVMYCASSEKDSGWLLSRCLKSPAFNKAANKAATLRWEGIFFEIVS